MSLLHTLIGDAVSPLKIKNFRTYIGGQAISLIGTFMQQAAMQWFVWTITRDTSWNGVVGALSMLPMFFLAPFTGSLADRVDRRKLMMIVIAGEMLLAFILAALAFAQIQVIWPVLLVALGLGVASAFIFPAQSAFIGDLSGMGEVRKAFAFNVTMIELGRILGPVVAGFIIDVSGPAWAFVFNGLSFLAVLASLQLVRAQQRPRPLQGSFMSGFLEAVRFIRGEPRIVDLLLCSLTITLFIFSSLQLASAIADLVLRSGPRLVGFMLGASGAGAIIGSFIIAPQLQKVARAGLALTMTLLWGGVWLTFTSFFANAAVIIAGIFLFSVSIPIVLGSVTSLTQMLTPDNMRARVLSVSQMISFGAQPIGALATGWLGAQLGPLGAVRVNGVLMIVAALTILAFRSGFQRWRTHKGDAAGTQPQVAKAI